ncbi:MAG: hypothetical protein J5884_05400 [Paludibacteraceae bacterium]|nr:hypothetical protein [Paludibacteraceae bacterium]
MKPKLFIISLLGILLFSMTSCPGVNLDGGGFFGWGLYVKTNDSLLVEYPEIARQNEHSITSDKEVRWKTMEVHKDTFRPGANWIHGIDLTNVEVHVYRQTSKENVRIFFIHDNIYGNIYNPDNSYNYHVLDSLMDVYGVTMPANQSALILPITSIWSK